MGKEVTYGRLLIILLVIIVCIGGFMLAIQTKVNENAKRIEENTEASDSVIYYQKKIIKEIKLLGDKK